MRVVFGAGDKVCLGSQPWAPRRSRHGCHGRQQKSARKRQIPRTAIAPQTRARPTPVPAGPQRWPPSSPPA